MKSAIGIMGGTFNPFHNGHLQLALQAYRQFELSKVLVMPSGTPAHKSTKELIAASHRCQMVSGAIADYPYLELSLLEVERKGNTYTSDTLKALHRQNPDLKMLLSVGGWGARGFTDAAATAESRAKFAQSCKEMIDRFDLAGIDLDWEYHRDSFRVFSLGQNVI